MEYIGPFVYRNNVLDYITTSEGRAVFSGGTFSFYEYHIRDHLGNVRVVFRNDNGMPQVIQKNDYYPFGLLMQERTNIDPNKNRYLYNGKEYISEGDLNWYDYGARMYDAQLGRFHVIDRFAEKYQDFSPYAYTLDNPIRFIDVNGDSVWIQRLFRKDVLYENGNLYNKDGTAYTGKVKGFLKATKEGLDDLDAVASGATKLSELESSIFNFRIKRGYGQNNFTPDSKSKAQLAGLHCGRFAAVAGSGGVIKWSPNATSGGLNTAGKTERPSFIILGHELLGHGLNSKRGLADYSTVPGFTFTRDENFATHVENQLRSEYNLPLRTHYGLNAAGGGVYPIINPGTSTSVYYPRYDYSVSNPMIINYVGPNSGR